MVKKQKVDKVLENECIRKFFFATYKDLAKAGGQKMQSLGMEAALEACEGLFKDKKLILKAFDKDTFYVFMKCKNKKEFELVYDSKGELV